MSLDDLADQINTIARLTGTFTLRSGQTATEYFDKYRFEAQPALLAEIVAAVEQPGRPHAVPLDVQGTAFQEAVWQELRKIPPGETRSYAEIAAAVGKPKAVRAAGSANGANNVAVLIPCHRVVRSDGALGGYAYGTEIKQALLERERGSQTKL